MPTLNWIGKDKVINHHQAVPYCTLEKQYDFGTPGSGNKIIHGDNLLALKALLPEYEGRVKCIYIDPPYNTGNENWVYNDNVAAPQIKKWLGQVVGKEGEDLSRHDKWLCMMYPRLQLLQKLLANNGAIFISIDDNEQANLKLLCDEIFGERNFVGNIIWQKKYTQSNDAKYLSSTHDFIICYTKNKDCFRFNLLERSVEQLKAYKNPDNDKRGEWMSQPIQVKTPSDAYIYEIVTPNGKSFFPPKGRSWQFSKERYEELVRDNRIWFGEDGNNVPRIKKFLSEVKGGVIPKTIWMHEEVSHNDEAKRTIKTILSNAVFDTPKPFRLLERIIQISADKDSIILDSFAGSGTTAHAVLNLNKQDGGHRKFILVEMEDYAESITAERVRRVARGYGEGKNATAGTGGGFSFFELGEPLMLGEYVNESQPVAKIQEYIWYTETHTPFARQETPYYLGQFQNAGYYFYYEKDRVTTLSHDTLGIVSQRAEQYVIYADRCLIGDDELRAKNIIFKKIPRDIRTF